MEGGDVMKCGGAIKSQQQTVFIALHSGQGTWNQQQKKRGGGGGGGRLRIKILHFFRANKNLVKE